VAVDPQESTPAPVGAPPPEQAVTEYRTVMELLSFLQKRDLELRIKFKTGNRLLTLNQEQIEANEARRSALLERYPNLVEQATSIEGEPDNPRSELFSQKAKIAALQAKIRFFESNLEEINKQFGHEYAIGSKIEELERRRQMEDAEYRSLEANLKNAKADQLLDPSRMPNIEVLQNPSEPIKSYDEKTKKIIMGLAGGGMALGLGLAFLIELLFDRRVKRPIEIRTRLQLPLMLSIPFIRRRERGGFMLTQDNDAPRIGRDEDALIPRDGFDELALNPAQPSKLGHFILPYSETIRDRIIFNFEVNNVTHKPKLVAVTGLCEGAGTSTIAAGLAKSFSEISGVKVLLVDLSSFHPEDSPLFGELPRHSLNAALHLARNSKFRDNPQNLYYASANARRDETGLTTFSPVHLYELMPHLQASDYDYIIFDMPPIDQTSRTLTMAGLMDKVLLVLDAENTSRDGLLWGYSELVKGRADVSCIFNKTRSHVPGWLIGDN
jgi:Mrp family chromosome partitioning ATPase